MPFNIEVAVDGAVDQIQRHEDALDNVSTKAEKTRGAVASVGVAGAQAGAAVADGARASAAAMFAVTNAAALAKAGVASVETSMQRLAEAKEQWASGRMDDGAWQKTQQIHQTYDHLRGGDISSASNIWKDDSGGLAKRMREIVADVDKSTGGGGGGSGAVDDRQAELLERIRGPMREYRADVDALTELLAQGKIVQADYDTQLERMTARIGALHGPVQQMTAEMQLQAQILDRLQAPTKTLAANLDALDALYTEGKISIGEYEAETAKAIEKSGQWQGPVQQVTEAMKRQEQVLESIKGPMREYEKNMEALEALHADGRITTDELQAKGEQVAKKAGLWQGPVQQETKQPEGISIGAAIGAAASGGAIMGLAHQIEDVVQKMHDLEDAATRAANAAQKFKDATHTVVQIQDEQIVLGDKLHATYTTTIGLYDKVREGSEGIALSHAEQLRMTQTLGEAVKLANKPIDSAAQIMGSLSTAMSTGSISVSDLKNTMRDVPSIANLWTSSFHTTREGLISMVKDGKVNVYDLVNSLLQGGSAIDAKFASIKRTNEETKEEWIETEKVLSQRFGVSFGMGHYTNDIAKGLAGDGASISSIIDNVVAKMDDLSAAAKRVDQANMHGVQAEIDKLNDPVDKAKMELEALNKAFGLGKVDIDVYEQELSKLLTTINRGRQPEALKINLPIVQAKASLQDLNDAFNQGDVTFEQYQKRYNELVTTINGTLPETEKLMTPVDNAKGALSDLQSAYKSGRIDAELYRKEYDSLMTTINDGRLPETIKYWEQFHLPMQQFHRDVAALDGLLRKHVITWDQYRATVQASANTAGIGQLWTALDQYQKPYQPQAVSHDRVANDAQVAQDQRQDTLGSQLGDAGLHYEQSLRDIAAATDRLHLSQQAQLALQDAARQQFASSTENLNRLTLSVSGYDAALAKLRATREARLTAGADPDAVNQQFQTGLAQLNRGRDQKAEFEQPSATYVQALRDIEAAQHDLGLSQRQAEELTRRATEAYRQQVDALDPVRKLLDDLEAPQRAYTEQMKVLEAARPDLTVNQYAQAVDKARVALLANSEEGKTFLGGLEQGFLQLKQSAESFGATVANTLVSDVDKLNSAIVTAASGGEVAWGQMIESILAGLEELLLKQIEIQAMNSIISAFKGGGDSATSSPDGTGGDAVGGLLSGLASKIGGSLLASAGGDATAAPAASATSATSATSAAMVAQSGPPAYPAAAQASVATTNRSAQTRNTGSGSDVQSTSPIEVHVHNHYDEDVVHAGMQSRTGQQILMNFLRANKNVIR